MTKKPVIILTGPTASGKTKFAVQLAREKKGEIISADSRQVFQGMDLGSGKDLAEYEEISYHLIDILPAGADFSVADFQTACLAALEDITSRNKLPIICGGTGHYIKALVEDYQFQEAPTDIEATNELEQKDREELAILLQKAGIFGQQDWSQTSKRRIVRALEKAGALPSKTEGVETEGSTTKATPFQDQYSYRGFYLEPPREVIREKIELRLTERFSAGMVAEVEGLLKAGIPAAKLLKYGLEYKWITLFLQGEVSSEEMKLKLATEIKRFAKRQMTFIRFMQKSGVALEKVGDFAELKKKAGSF